MKVIGSIYGEVINPETGEVVRTFEGENHIQDSLLTAWASQFANNSNLYINNNKIFVSETNPREQRRSHNTSLPACWSGGDIGGIPSPTIEEAQDEGAGVHLIEFTNTLAPNAYDVIINMAGLCTNVNAVNQLISNVDTAVWFNSPCLWEASNILNVYYKIQVFYDIDWQFAAADEKKLNYIEQLGIGRTLISAQYDQLPVDGEDDIWVNGMGRVNLRKLSRTDIDRELHSIDGITVSYNYRQEYFHKEKVVTLEIDDGVGRLIGTCCGQNYMAGFKAVDADTDPLQGVFLHLATSTVPFYRVSDAGTGLGGITIDASSWDKENYANYYEINITTEGGDGVGEYNFRKRLSTGFLENTFENDWIPLPYSSAYNGHYFPSQDTDEEDTVHFALCRDHADDVSTVQDAVKSSKPIRYSDTEVLALWIDSFAFVNILTGEGESFHATTKVGTDVIPRFLASRIGQVAIASNGDFYISCESSDLYKFSADRQTLDAFLADGATGLPGTLVGCHGVSVTASGRVWAYFRDGTTPADSDLYYSDDGGTNWTAAGFSQATIDATPSVVKQVETDPQDDDHVLVIYADDPADVVSTEVFGVWWDEGTNTATDITTRLGYQDYTGYPYRKNPVFDHPYWYGDIAKCSPNDSNWVSSYSGSYNGICEFRELTFGVDSSVQISADTQAGHQPGHWTWEQNAAGDDILFYITQVYNHSSPWSGSFADIGALRMDGTIEHEVFQENINEYFPPLCYMGKGMWLMGSWSTTVPSNGPDQSVSYWNMWMLMNTCPAARDLSATPDLEYIHWDDYGWTGAAWALDNVNSKPIHSAAEVLLDTITVAWDDSTGDFLTTDMYTFGVYDGIWQDGSTTFDFTFGMYVKPTKVETSIEASTIPAPSARVSNLLEKVDLHSNDYSLSDALNMSLNDTFNAFSGGSGASGARTTQPAMHGTRAAHVPNSVRTPKEISILTEDSNIVSLTRVRVYNVDSQDIDMTFGLSVASKIGNALDADDIDYSIRLDSSEGDGANGTTTVRVYENGTLRHTLLDHDSVAQNVRYDSGIGINNELHFIFALLGDGRMVYCVRDPLTYTWTEIWRSPSTGLVTLEDLHFDIVQNISNSYGLRDVEFWNLPADTGNFLYLGNGSDEGVHSPYFFAIDPQSVTVTINGSPGVDVGASNMGATLAAGEYSIFPEGLIRVSDSDNGNSIAVEYTTITDE